MTPKRLTAEYGRCPARSPRRLGLAILIAQDFMHLPSVASTLATHSGMPHAQAFMGWNQILRRNSTAKISIDPAADFRRDLSPAALASLKDGGFEDRSGFNATTPSMFIYLDPLAVAAVRRDATAAGLLNCPNAARAFLVVACCDPQSLEDNERAMLFLQDPRLAAHQLHPVITEICNYRQEANLEQRRRRFLQQHLDYLAHNASIPVASSRRQAVMQALVSCSWELGTLADCMACVRHGPLRNRWLELLRGHATSLATVALGEIFPTPQQLMPVLQCVQHGGEPGTRDTYTAVAPHRIEIAVFEPAAARTIVRTAQAQGLLTDDRTELRAAYFQAMICKDASVITRKVKLSARAASTVERGLPEERVDRTISMELLGQSRYW